MYGDMLIPLNIKLRKLSCISKFLNKANIMAMTISINYTLTILTMLALAYVSLLLYYTQPPSIQL